MTVQRLRELLHDLPPDTPVYLEDGEFGNLKLENVCVEETSVVLTTQDYLTEYMARVFPDLAAKAQK